MKLNISAKKLAASILTPTFSSALFAAGRRTTKNFNETGFSMFWNHPDRIKYSKVAEGNYFSLERDGIGEELIPEVDQLLVGSFHFHPEVTGPAVPSGGDEGGDLHLPRLWFNQEVMIKGDRWTAGVRPIFGVAKPRPGGNVELLVFQTDGKPTPLHTDVANDAIESYFEQRDIKPFEEEIVHCKVRTQEIATLMRGYGFNTAVLDFPSPREKGRSMSARALEKILAPFAQRITLEISNDDDDEM